MKKCLFILAVLSFIGVCKADEQPPFEVKDPATTENFRQIYYQVDQLGVTRDSNGNVLVSSPAIVSSLMVATNTLPSGYNAVIETVPNNFALQIRSGNEFLRFGAGDPEISASGGQFQIRQLSANQSIVFRNDSAATVIIASMSAAGEITQPTQPSFCATMSGAANNVTGNGTVYTVNFDTERFDQGSDFAASTFTAPVSGVYLLQAQVIMGGQSAMSDANLQIITSNVNYYGTEVGSTFGTATVTFHATVLADMDAGDTAVVHITSSGGTLTADITAGDSGGRASYFSGSLVN